MNGQYGPEAVLNSRGLLLQNQYVYIFVGGTGTLANTFADEDSTDPGPNPAITSPTGNLTFFALSGNYDLSLTNPPTDVVSIALVGESDSDATGNVWEGPGAAGGLTPDVPNSPYGEGNTAIGYYALPNTETGFWNVAIGYQAFPSFSANPSHGPARSVAIGAFADVADLGSGMDWGTAVGSSATAAEWGTAIGAGAVSAENSVALGYQADASRGGITVGNGRSVLRGISVGYGSPEAISGTGHIVVGDATFIDANYDCLALGTSASVVGGTGVVQSVAIGVFAFVNNAANAIAMGWSATVEGDRAIAMGWNAVATGEDSVALGSGAVSAVDNQIVLGTTSHTTQIPGLPASVSGDKFLVADSSGNVHKSSSGPSGDKPYATIVIAAHDSIAPAAASADYVCTGTADDVTIQNAFNANHFAKFVFLDGNFIGSAAGGYQISQIYGGEIEGQGSGNTRFLDIKITAQGGRLSGFWMGNENGHNDMAIYAQYGTIVDGIRFSGRSGYFGFGEIPAYTTCVVHALSTATVRNCHFNGVRAPLGIDVDTSFFATGSVIQGNIFTEGYYSSANPISGAHIKLSGGDAATTVTGNIASNFSPPTQAVLLDTGTQRATVVGNQFRGESITNNGTNHTIGLNG